MNTEIAAIICDSKVIGHVDSFTKIAAPEIPATLKLSPTAYTLSMQRVAYGNVKFAPGPEMSLAFRKTFTLGETIDGKYCVINPIPKKKGCSTQHSKAVHRKRRRIHRRLKCLFEGCYIEDHRPAFSSDVVVAEPVDFIGEYYDNTRND